MNLNLRSSTDVLAAVPHILGFVPTNSIVGIVLDGDDRGPQSILVAARYDSAAPIEGAAQFTDALPLVDDHGMPRSILLIAIADAAGQRNARDHIDVLNRRLSVRGNSIIKRLYTPALDAGHTWVDIDTGETGQTMDYRTTDLALELAVEHGHSVSASRADIAAEFAPGDPAPAPSGTPDSAEFITHTVLGMYAAFNNPDLLTPQLAADTGHLITASVAHRDTLLVVSTSEPHGGATAWTRLARQLRGPARIEALALAAACFYAGNDAVRAGLALEAAHDTATAAGLDDTVLVQLLDTALQTGVSPAKIRQLFARLTDTPPAD